MSERRHPTPECVEFMRRTLLDDLDEAVDTRPRREDWTLATIDANVPFPGPSSLRAETWVRWARGVENQLRNAATVQIASYYREKYEECPVCGENVRRCGQGQRHRYRS